MKINVPVALASLLLVSACANYSQDRAGAQAPMATTSASTIHDYQCVSDEAITASYPSTDSATIQYKGNMYNMKHAVSASGARYDGGKLKWWAKGYGQRI